MTAGLDIYRCAKLLCDECGDDADIIAAARADKLLKFGEIVGHATWMTILEAIVEIRSAIPTPASNDNSRS